MKNKNEELLNAQIERESKYLSDQEVGTEEYKSSLNRLTALMQQKEELKDNKIKNAIETAKVVAGYALPLVGLVVIVQEQKEITFVGALRDVTKCFLPKKMF